jgi:hypothetical protein
VTESIAIRGGMTSDASNEFAQVGDLHVQRGACEDIDQFKARVLALSEATNRTAVFGGLPKTQFEDDDLTLNNEQT